MLKLAGVSKDAIDGVYNDLTLYRKLSQAARILIYAIRNGRRPRPNELGYNGSFYIYNPKGKDPLDAYIYSVNKQRERHPVGSISSAVDELLAITPQESAGHAVDPQQVASILWPKRDTIHQRDQKKAMDQLYTAIVTLTAQHGYQPTYRELTEYLGWHSTDTVQRYVNKLRADGRVKGGHKPRTLRAIPAKEVNDEGSI